MMSWHQQPRTHAWQHSFPDSVSLRTVSLVHGQRRVCPLIFRNRGSGHDMLRSQNLFDNTLRRNKSISSTPRANLTDSTNWDLYPTVGIPVAAPISCQPAAILAIFTAANHYSARKFYKRLHFRQFTLSRSCSAIGVGTTESMQGKSRSHRALDVS
jgi:hypothetical protein